MKVHLTQGYNRPNFGCFEFATDPVVGDTVNLPKGVYKIAERGFTPERGKIAATWAILELIEGEDGPPPSGRYEFSN